MSEKNIKCKECRYYNKSSKEYSVDMTFVNGTWNVLNGYGKAIRMCCHPDCFEIKHCQDPVEGKYTIKVRTKGQWQLNKNNDCKRFGTTSIFK